MSVLKDTWRGLVQRRLWPVALLLLAALAAVPVALARDAEPPAPAPNAPVATTAAELATAPIVATASADDREKLRKVVGSPKNPFRPVPVKAKPATDEAPAAAPQGGDAGVVVSLPELSSGGSAGPAPVTTVDPAPVTSAPKPRKTYEHYSIDVRWGESTADRLARRTFKRLRALPSLENPLLVYLGVLEDGETAVFMLDARVAGLGDGECRPRGGACETIHLRAGETEFFDVTDDTGAVVAQYQLDLLKIHKRTNTVARAATAVAPGGRRVLRARMSQAAAYRFDADRGVLERVPVKDRPAKPAAPEAQPAPAGA